MRNIKIELIDKEKSASIEYKKGYIYASFDKKKYKSEKTDPILVDSEILMNEINSLIDSGNLDYSIYNFKEVK